MADKVKHFDGKLHKLPPSLSIRLNAVRREKGLSQEYVADEVGINQAALSRYETGKTNPSPPTLAALCTVLNISADYLIGVQDIPAKLR